MYLIDSSLLVNQHTVDLVTLTQEEKDLLRLLVKIPPHQIYTADFVLTEFSLIMTRVMPKKYKKTERKIFREITKRTARIIREFLLPETNVFTPTQEEIERGSDLFLENAGKKVAEEISLPDFWLAAIAEERGLVLLTTDKALQRFARQRGIVVNQKS
jgi:predicted nucleic acid-binding protein